MSVHTEVDYKTAIRPMLRTLMKELRSLDKPLQEAGQVMATEIKTSMEAQVGVQRPTKYVQLSVAYARRKGTPRKGRILFGTQRGARGSSLAGSWRVLRLTKDSVLVGAGGDPEQAIKASAHDGGLARYLSRPRLNRLKLGFNKKLLQRAGGAVLDELIHRTNRHTPRTPR